MAKMNSGLSCRGFQPGLPAMVGTVPDRAVGQNRRGRTLLALPGWLYPAGFTRLALPGWLYPAGLARLGWPGRLRRSAFRCGGLRGGPAADQPAPAPVDRVPGDGQDGG